MQPLQPYHDVPGVCGGEYFMTDPFGSAPLYHEHDNSWNSLDPSLQPMRHNYKFYEHQSTYAISNPQRGFTAYDPYAHGFDYGFPARASGQTFYQLGLATSWPGEFEQYRHTRYASPTASGVSMSSSDSTFNDHVISPDVMRSTASFTRAPQNVHQSQSPPRDLSIISYHSWTSPKSYVPAVPSTPIMSSQTACSMKELQLTPDAHLEEDLRQDPDIIRVNQIQVPEELELSEPGASESEFGPSLPDTDSMNEDEDDYTQEDRESDSEFMPTQSLRKATAATRQSLRTPRRAASMTTTTVLDRGARVHKSNHTRKPSSAPPKTKKTNLKKHGSSTNKSFCCTFHQYGCLSTFANKNEWKRHVASQHLQLGFYRCDMDSCSPAVARAQNKGYNDFNRKDLFTQHCRRMHAPWVGKGRDPTKSEAEAFEKEMETVRGRCWRIRRQAPLTTTCGFCGKEFKDKDGSGKGWEDRMEHLGRHYEREGRTPEEEAVDVGLRKWAVDEGVIREGKGPRKGQYWLVGFEPAEGVKSRGKRRTRARNGAVAEQVQTDRVDEQEEEQEEDVKPGNGQDIESDDDQDAEGDSDDGMS